MSGSELRTCLTSYQFNIKQNLKMPAVSVLHPKCCILVEIKIKQGDSRAVNQFSICPGINITESRYLIILAKLPKVLV